ncbi:dihydropyrimidinase [Paenibacillus residui]|uniref:Dihydropyrimidinase n=1 Tax=Paenibacillus residui TaxID=629724 RepID=A0ABW3DCS7_9BACL
MRTIIRNGTIVTSRDLYQADVLMEDGIITGLGKNLKIEDGDRIIEAEGRYVLPGGIDVHTHLGIPDTVDDFESGTRAAAMGGITTIINYVDPVRGQSLLETLRVWKEKAMPSCIDYGFHSIINECNERVLEELPLLADKEGVTSIKLFMAYKETNMVNDLQMYRLMKKAGESGILTCVHAENGDVIDELVEEAVAQGRLAPIYHALTRPETLEAEAVNRALRIAETAKAPVYIVHVSCADAMNEVGQAVERGGHVYAETCPHYLVLDQSYLELPDFEGGKYVCSPPLREKWNQDKLWEGIASGNIHTIGSDHASIPFEGGKTRGRNNFAQIPNGLPGIETTFPLLYHYGVYEQRVSLSKFVEITSTNPARIFGLYPKKGTIAVGSDADITIVDPARSKVISHRTQQQGTDYNVYEGMELQGATERVFSRGEELVSNGLFVGKPGRGQYLHRQKISPSDALKRGMIK